jgi:hypothetical protein
VAPPESALPRARAPVDTVEDEEAEADEPYEVEQGEEEAEALERIAEEESGAEEDMAEGSSSEGEEEEEAGWWTRRLQASGDPVLGGSGSAKAARPLSALTSLTAFRADGDPLSVHYEWRVEDARAEAEGEGAARARGARDPAGLALSPTAAGEAAPSPARAVLLRVPSASAGPARGDAAAGAVAEAVEGDADSPARRQAAQAAGIDPALVSGLAKKRTVRSGREGRGARVHWAGMLGAAGRGMERCACCVRERGARS